MIEEQYIEYILQHIWEKQMEYEAEITEEYYNTIG